MKMGIRISAQHAPDAASGFLPGHSHRHLQPAYLAVKRFLHLFCQGKQRIKIVFHFIVIATSASAPIRKKQIMN